MFLSFAHKNMVKTTQKGSHMLIDRFDKMHDPNMIMEETKTIQKKKCQMLKTNIEKYLEYLKTKDKVFNENK